MAWQSPQKLLSHFLTGMRTSFEVRMVFLSVVTAGIAVVAALGVFMWQGWTRDEAVLLSEQLRTADHLGPAGQAALARSPVPTLNAGPLTGDAPAIAAVYIADDGRRAFFGARSELTDGVDPSLLLVPSHLYRDGHLELHAPHLVAGQRAGEVVVFASEAEIMATLRRNAAAAAGLSFAAMLLAAWLSRLFVRQALRPLATLEWAIDRVRHMRDFDLDAERTSDDDFGRLTDSFNALLAELRTYDAELHRHMAELSAAKQAADEASVLKSQFLANMSHEIRTPLNGVLGMAQVMAMNPLEAAQRQRLDVITSSGETLLAILNDILDLSKVEAGHLTLESAPFDMAEIARSAEAVYAPIAHGKGLAFQIEVSASGGGMWRGDPVRVRQILYNLISNAVKFTEKGKVRVAIDRLGPEAGGQLRVRVSDTGIGIPEEVMPRLFQKFSQADNSTTRRFGGTGLGLAISRRIAELMDGTIRVESQPGRGSVFEVLLGLAYLGERAEPEEADAADEAPRDLSGLRVLAAEDNPTNQLVLRTILQAMGVDPTIVADGEQAVAAWRRGGFDLILMDIQMPVMDGVTATRAIRQAEADHNLAPTRILALSANAMSHQIEDYLAAGMDGHLAKPIEIAKLQEALAECATIAPAPPLAVAS